MRDWHSLYDILVFPIGVIMFACFLFGLGNLFTNPAFSSIINVKNDLILLSAEAMMRIGTQLIVYFPLLFLIRIVTRKTGSSTTITSAVFGYISYLVFTMYFSRADLPSTAYSSILGLSVSSSNVSGMSSTVHYPLQTGLLATALVSFAVLNSYTASRRRSDYGFFSFISRDVWCLIRSIILCSIFGVIVAYVWPYVTNAIQELLTFISSDTTNPINLTIYGMADRFFSLLNMGALIRTPFWYGTAGGSWIGMSGINVIGDVNIWTNQLASSSINGMAGRFITPYYVLNIFAIPAMMLAFHQIQTDKIERRRMRMYYIVVAIISIFSGSLLPIELMLLLLCPLLYVFHISYTGFLFGVLQSMRVYLGYNHTGTSIIASAPGTLLELITYLQNGNLTGGILKLAIVGIISAAVYYFATLIFFNYLALDLFRTGDRERAINGTISACGGISNIKLVHSSMNRLVISLFDPSKLDVRRLKSLGALRTYETKAGYAISFGASSTMIRRGINKKMTENSRKTR